MAETLTDKTLRSRGLAVLEEKLGRTATLRFLALLSREPFDYKLWREEEFGRMSVDDIVAEAQAASG